MEVKLAEGNIKENGREAYDIPQEFCMFGIRLSVAVHRSSEVPLPCQSQLPAQSCVALTNLMATFWLLSRLVPSNITPNEPSPIFFPTL